MTQVKEDWVRPFCDLEAEREVIGTILTHGLECFFTLKKLMTCDDLHSYVHQRMWQAFEDLQHRRQRINMQSCADAMTRLGTLGLLNHHGGLDYFGQLLDSEVGVLSAAYAAARIKEHWCRRKIILRTDWLLARAIDPGISLEELYLMVSRLALDCVPSPGGKQ